MNVCRRCWKCAPLKLKHSSSDPLALQSKDLFGLRFQKLQRISKPKTKDFLFFYSAAPSSVPSNISQFKMTWKHLGGIHDNLQNSVNRENRDLEIVWGGSLSLSDPTGVRLCHWWKLIKKIGRRLSTNQCRPISSGPIRVADFLQILCTFRLTTTSLGKLQVDDWRWCLWLLLISPTTSSLGSWPQT